MPETLVATTVLSSQSTTLEIAEIFGELAVLRYITPSGNAPAAYGNFIAVWQGTGVDLNTPPSMRVAIQSDSAAGEIAIEGVDSRVPLTFGYAVGAALTDVCASASTPAGSAAVFTPAINIEEVSGSGVAVRCLYLPGSPVAGRCALWKGASPSYSAAPLTTVSLPTGAGQSSVFLSASLTRGATYSVAILTGEATTTIAAAVSFTA
jgi:hypothetical protein